MFLLSFSSSSFQFSSKIYSNSKELQNIKLAHSGSVREGGDYSKALPGHTEIHSQIRQSLKTLKYHLQFILPRQQSRFSAAHPGSTPPHSQSPQRHLWGHQRIWKQGGSGWLIDDGDFKGRRESLPLPVIKFTNHRLADSSNGKRK